MPYSGAAEPESLRLCSPTAPIVRVQVLNLTRAEAAGVVKAIKADQALGKQKFTPTNNCTTKVRQVLEIGTHKPFELGAQVGILLRAILATCLNFQGMLHRLIFIQNQNNHEPIFTFCVRGFVHFLLGLLSWYPRVRATLRF